MGAPRISEMKLSSGEAKREWPGGQEAEGMIDTGGLGGVESGPDMEHEVPEMMVVPVMEKSTSRQTSKSWLPQRHHWRAETLVRRGGGRTARME